MNSVSAVFEKAKLMEGFLVASLTDEYIVDKWSKSNLPGEYLMKNEHKLLELRIFDKQKEVKLFRPKVGDDFLFRIRDDSQPYIKEKQLLDVDTKRSVKLFENSHKVYATGGGCYYYPLSKLTEKAAVIVHYYYDYYEATGQIRIVDWRAVSIKEE